MLHILVKCESLVKQSTNNAMKINQRKTKEMLIGPIVKDQPPQLTLNLLKRHDVMRLIGIDYGRASHHIQAARSPRLQQPQVVLACRRNIVQGLVSTLFPETAQTLRCISTTYCASTPQ